MLLAAAEGIDVSQVTTTLTDLGTAVMPIVLGGIAVSATIFAALFSWKKGKKAVNS